MRLAVVTGITVLLSTRTLAAPTGCAQGVTVTESDLSNLKFYAQYAAAAYCNSQNAVGQPIKCANNTCPNVEADGATTAATFSGTVTGIEGLIALDSNKSLIVATFRGTSSIRNILFDATFPFAPCDLALGCLTHAGFLSSWTEISAPVLASVAAARASHPSYSVIVTGHSLGGAVASFAAAYLRKQDPSLKVDLYTYGSPRVGNDVFANYVSGCSQGRTYRVTHTDDPVPRLPPLLLGFRHTSPEYWLSTGGAETTNYGVQDIKVCQGTANTRCNGGTMGLDSDAHLYYFEHISGCSVQEPLRKRDGDGIGDRELEMTINMLAAGDVALAEALENQCTIS